MSIKTDSYLMGDNIKINIGPSMLVIDIMNELSCEYFYLPTILFRLHLNDVELEEYKSCEEYNITKDTIINAKRVLHEENSFQVFIRVDQKLSSRQVIVLNVSPSMTIDDILSILNRRYFHVAQYILFLKLYGCQLSSSRKVSDYKITKECSINVEMISVEDDLFDTQNICQMCCKIGAPSIKFNCGHKYMCEPCYMKYVLIYDKNKCPLCKQII
jgi:hypothetical protein